MIPQDSHTEKEDVRQYLQMLQDIINRMAANSSNCKAWAITLFTAMAALFIGVDGMRQWSGIVIIPIVLFYFLDAYYLGLENNFRDLESSFIKKLRSIEDCSAYVYDFNITHADGYKKNRNLKKGLMSNATWPLYSVLTMVCIIICLIFTSSINPEPKQQELEEPLRQIVIKQDSLLKVFSSFNDKYEPVTIESKAYHNSSFFKANNVDSIEIKVFGNK